jgi:signal transduction histidine kinase
VAGPPLGADRSGWLAWDDEIAPAGATQEIGYPDPSLIFPHFWSASRMMTPGMDEGQLEVAELIHDLRNPLTAIIGRAQLLRRSLDLQPETPVVTVQELVSGILVSASLMTTMLDDMLAASRHPIGGASTATSLATILDLAVEQVEQVTGQRRVHLVQPTRPTAGTWDRIRVDRALVNVLENALKYSPDGGAVIVTVREGGADVVVTIQDQGIGIPEDELPGLFDGFVRASNARGRFTGTGLGLVSARRLIESQSGSLKIASVEGCGTTVTIMLPL